ncbi:MAG TPA: hypothetical protein VG733_08605 [Chthoniobacteraceae bacterium]|nr:hypothetical protein [Chthoniobacteraceae bacterium]
MLLIFRLAGLRAADDPQKGGGQSITGEVVQQGNLLMFRCDQPVKDNPTGNVIFYSPTEESRRSFFRLAIPGLKLRMSGKFAPYTGKATVVAQGPLPNVEFIASKIEAADDPDAPIRSLLAHGDTVFASTLPGLFTASLKAGKWRRMDVPGAMEPGGIFAKQDPASPMMAYYLPSVAYDQGPVKLFVSKDAGKTWGEIKIAEGRKFYDFYILPNGWIYGIEETGELPAFIGMAREDGMMRVADDVNEFFKKHPPEGIEPFCGVFCSKDMGATWNDVTANLPSDYEFGGMFADPDHADQVCVIGHYARHISKGMLFQCDPATGQWTKNDMPGWHPEMYEDRDAGRRFAYIGDRTIPAYIHATLSNFFTLPFLEPVNGDDLSVFIVRAEAGNTAYTFPAKGPKMIPVKVRSLDEHAPLKFLDSADQAMFWGVELLPREYNFAGLMPKDSQYSTSNTAMTNRQKKIDAVLHAPATKTVALTAKPYEREIDLSKMGDLFAKPGTYKIQLYHEDGCISPDGGILFGTGIIEVTITP